MLNWNIRCKMFLVALAYAVVRFKKFFISNLKYIKKYFLLKPYYLGEEKKIIRCKGIFSLRY